MSACVWGLGKKAFGAICDKKHVGKHTFGNRASRGGVRKGGIIKGVWLPRGRHHPLKRSVEGLDGRALNTVSLRHGDETWRCGNSALCASRAEGVICHAEYRRADALPCRGAFQRLTARAAHPGKINV
jgi:hypothetical protein